MSNPVIAGSDKAGVRQKRKKKEPSPILGDELSYTLPTAVRISGSSRTGLYKLIAAGELDSFKVQGRRMIDGPSLRRRFRAPVAA